MPTQFFVYNYSQVLILSKVHNSLVAQSIVIFGIILTQVQNPALGLVELHNIYMGSPFRPVRAPLDGIPSMQCVKRTTQIGVIFKPFEDSLNPIVHVTVHYVTMTMCWKVMGLASFLTAWQCVGVLPRHFAFNSVSPLFSNTLSLSLILFDLFASVPITFYYIVLSCILILYSVNKLSSSDCSSVFRPSSLLPILSSFPLSQGTGPWVPCSISCKTGPSRPLNMKCWIWNVQYILNNGFKNLDVTVILSL